MTTQKSPTNFLGWENTKEPFVVQLNRRRGIPSPAVEGKWIEPPTDPDFSKWADKWDAVDPADRQPLRTTDSKYRAKRRRRVVGGAKKGKRASAAAPRRFAASKRKRASGTPAALRPYVEYMRAHGRPAKKATVLRWWASQKKR